MSRSLRCYLHSSLNTPTLEWRHFPSHVKVPGFPVGKAYEMQGQGGLRRSVECTHDSLTVNITFSTTLGPDR